MTIEEIAVQYAKGQLSRRQFIRTLVARGVAFFSAAAFADALEAQSKTTPRKGTAPGGVYGEFYGSDQNGISTGQEGSAPAKTKSTENPIGSGTKQDEPKKEDEKKPEDPLEKGIKDVKDWLGRKLPK